MTGEHRELPRLVLERLAIPGTGNRPPSPQALALLEYFLSFPIMTIAEFDEFCGVRVGTLFCLAKGLLLWEELTDEEREKLSRFPGVVEFGELFKAIEDLLS